VIGADGIFLFPATLHVCECAIYDKSVKVKRIGTLFTASDALQSGAGSSLSLFISPCMRHCAKTDFFDHKQILIICLCGFQTSRQARLPLSANTPANRLKIAYLLTSF
jgi:hypothetical protein